MLARVVQEVVREPLTWFALIAVALMAFEGRPDEHTELRVTDAEVASVLADWQARTGRAPDGSQRSALIEDYEAEATWAQYARELGLDRGDRIVRARLRRKAETLAAAEAAPVTEADARAEYARRADTGRTGARYTFTQRPTRLRHSTLPTTLTAVSYDEVVTLFGSEFAAALAALPPPPAGDTLTSPYGEHAVQLTSVGKSSAGSFEQLRARIVTELTQQRRREAIAARLTLLRRRYGLEERGDTLGGGARSGVR